MNILAWSMPAAVSIHVFEEFVWPGGFKAWYIAYKPEIALSVTNRFLVIINAVLIAFSINVALVGGSPDGIFEWLILGAVVAENAVFHIVGAIKTKRYSPGMVSGTLIYLPLSLYGLIHYVVTGQIKPVMALCAVALGLSYYFVSYANHRRRAKRTQSSSLNR